MAYADIADSDIDAKSGFKTGVLMGQLNDNIKGLYGEMRQYVVKQNPENVPSSTVLQDDDELSFSVAANSKWYFELTLFVTTTVLADFKLAMVGPAGATGRVFASWMMNAAGDNLSYNEAALGGSISLAAAVATTLMPVRVYGAVTVGGTAGTLKLQWAQDTSDAVATTVGAGSTLSAWLGTNLAAAIPGSYTAIADSDIDPDSELIQTNMELIRDNPIYVFHEHRKFVRKPGTETVTSSTALQDDDHFFVTVGADEWWHLRMVFRISTNAVADFKYRVVLPSIPTTAGISYFTIDTSYVDHDGAKDVLRRFQTPRVTPSVTPTVDVLYNAAISSTLLVWTDAVFQIGSTGGTLNIQWAQRVSDPGNTQMLLDSIFWAERMTHYS